MGCNGDATSDGSVHLSFDAACCTCADIIRAILHADERPEAALQHAEQWFVAVKHAGGHQKDVMAKLTAVEAAGVSLWFKLGVPMEELPWAAAAESPWQRLERSGGVKRKVTGMSQVNRCWEQVERVAGSLRGGGGWEVFVSAQIIVLAFFVEGLDGDEESKNPTEHLAILLGRFAGRWLAVDSEILGYPDEDGEESEEDLLDLLEGSGGGIMAAMPPLLVAKAAAGMSERAASALAEEVRGLQWKQCLHLMANEGGAALRAVRRGS